MTTQDLKQNVVHIARAADGTRSRSIDAINASWRAIPGPEAVLQLLSLANSALESDRNTARACIARAAALLRNTARDAGRIPQMKNPCGDLATWQQHRLLIYIDAHLGRGMKARELAALVDLSVGHFSRMFRKTFDDPPMAFVAKQRMQRAQHLMLETHEPLANIALACGLCDQAHFTRVFRKIFGIAPRAWRRLYATQPFESTGSRGSSGHFRRTTEQVGRPWITGALGSTKKLYGIDVSRV
jgi:AraC family transcriptional regulator